MESPVNEFIIQFPEAGHKHRFFGGCELELKHAGPVAVVMVATNQTYYVGVEDAEQLPCNVLLEVDSHLRQNIL